MYGRFTAIVELLQIAMLRKVIVFTCAEISLELVGF